MQLRYKSLFNKILMSYYFYLKPFEKMDSSDIYELLVHFHLLSLATKVSDVGMNGNDLINLEILLKQWSKFNKDDIENNLDYYEKNELAKLARNARTDHII